MKLSWRGLLGLLVVFLAGAPGAHAQDAKAAEAFVQKLYARYRSEENFSPYASQKVVDAISTPSLAALYRRDQQTNRAAHDESDLDSDPLSGSQDPDGLQVVRLKVELPKPGQAVVTATLRIGMDPVVRRLFLVSIKGEWRIDNLTDTKGEEDLRATLTQSIALHSSSHKHSGGAGHHGPFQTRLV